MSREQIIDKHRSLFWYTPEAEKQNISDALLVERILNDGTLDDYRELIDALGGKRVAEVFFSAKGRSAETELLPRNLPFLFSCSQEVCIVRF